MGDPLILQRLRFRDCAPPSPTSPRLPESFDSHQWTQDCESTYWKKPGSPTGFGHTPNGLLLHSGQIVSSDSFFNAFFLRYWKELTTLQSLGLKLRYKGQLRLEVYGVSDEGRMNSLLQQVLPAAEAETELSLQFPFTIDTISYLRLSFTLTALADGALLAGGGWYTLDKPSTPVSLGILMPTFNRPHFAERTVRRILDDPGLRSEKIHIWLVEQSDAPTLNHLAGDRCHVIRQGNLGCTGGYTRALYECLYEKRDPKPTHFLFMDDDIDLETDSILRSIRLLQFARTPFVLGGSMLSLYQPNSLENFGGYYSKGNATYYFLIEYLKGFSAASTESLQVISKPNITDIGAWWFTIFPVSVIESMGLPIPFFLKMDDVEYSVRARRKGVPLYMVPGVGLWHMPFDSKRNDAVDYISFYNHLLANAYFGAEEGKGMFRFISGFIMTTLQQRRYRTAAVFLRCLEDFSGGWPHFRDGTFPHRWHEVSKDLAGYPADGSTIDSHQKQRIIGLNQRLKDVFIRGMENMETIHSDLARNLPTTTRPDAWKEYLQRGNSTFLS